MRVYAELLTTPSADTPGTAVMVHFDDKRYILGHIAEGTQRAVAERKARLGKIREVFITGRTEWATMGGLVGLILTVGSQERINGAGEMGVVGGESGCVNVHGGENLLHAVASTRSFVLRTRLKLKVFEMGEGGAEGLEMGNVFKDNNVTIKALHIRPEGRSRAAGESPSPERTARKKRSIEEVMKRERMEVLQNTVKNMFWNEQQSVDAGSGPTAGIEEEDPLASAESPEKRSRLDDGEDENTEDAGAGAGAEDDKITTDEKPAEVKTRSAAGTPMPPWMQQRLPPSKPSPVAVSYIMRLHDHRGKFFPKVALELGCVPNMHYKLLTEGHPITTEAGTVVTPEQVMEPTRKGTGIAVCDLPDATYISHFTAQRDWDEDVSWIGCFYWILGPGVQDDVRLQSFMARHPGAQHVISSPDTVANSIKFKGAAKFAHRLNKLDPGFFPLAQSCDTPAFPPVAGAVAAEAGLVWNIEPSRSLVVPEVEPTRIEDYFVDIEPGFSEAVNKIHAELAENPSPLEEFPGSDVEVVTLGTGSSIPSRYRNVSATLVIIPSVGNILLDSGENTLGQLRRMYTPDLVTAHLRNLRALYISHMHADHHLGAISLLKAQTKLVPRDQKVYIVAPARFHAFLQEYSNAEFFAHKDRMVFVPNEFLRSGRAEARGKRSMLKALDMQDWVCADARHCQSSYTTALTFNDGFKVAYSGDTRPTEAFVDIAKNTTLLVHEATFDDELAHEALAKSHSTISEAVQAGRDMNARMIALTHFSQRYPKKPKINGEGDEGRVLFGFDGMRFKIGEVAKFGRLADGVEQVYMDVGDEYEKGGDEKAVKAAAVVEEIAEENAAKKERKKRERNKKRAEKAEREKMEKKSEEPIS